MATEKDNDRDVKTMGLTEEELAALEENDDELDNDDDDDIDNLGDEGLDDGDDDPAAVEAAKAAEAEAAAKKAADDEAAAKAAEAAAEERRPIINAKVPDGAEDRLKEIPGAKEELLQKFDDGDLTTKEYHDALEKLNKEERDLEWAINKAAMAAEMDENLAQEAWARKVNSFLDRNDDYRKFPLRYQALDHAVKTVAMDEANKDLDGDAILEKAHAMVSEQFGIQAPAGGKQQDAGGRKPAIPPNLGKLPAADTTTDSENRFAHLDRLAETDPIAYEAALAKMSDADSDEYLSKA